MRYQHGQNLRKVHKIASAGEDVAKLYLSSIAPWDIKWYSHFEKSTKVSYKAIYVTTM
jgi:hypothetical protein